MDKQSAEATLISALKASYILDKQLSYLKPKCGADEFSAICKNFGKCLGEIYFQIIEPITREHPDLKPRKLGGTYDVDENIYRDI
jgi:hypothetical protein